MAVSLLEEITGNAALFEDDETQGADNGDITWTEPEEVTTGNWEFEFEGTDTDGVTINPTTKTMASSEKPSPSEIFWWLVEKARPIICPTCGPGY